MAPPVHPRSRCGKKVARLRSEKRGGFSLIEILVAIAVLTLLAVFLVQLTSAVQQTTRSNNRAVEAASQARLVFDRLAMDFAGLVRRSDVDFFAHDGTGTSLGYDTTNSLLFLSEVSSPGRDRILSLIAYRLAPHPDNRDSAGVARLGLSRAGIPAPWTKTPSTTNFMGLKADGRPVRFASSDTNFSSSLLPSPPSGSNANSFDVLAPGVLQMAIGYQLRPDNQPVVLKSGASLTNAQGQVVYSPPVRGTTGSPADRDIDLSRVASIVVGVVAIDLDSLSLLSAADANALSAQFAPSALQNGQLPSEAWASTLNTLFTSGPGSLPARQALRIYQRFYPVNSFGNTAL